MNKKAFTIIEILIVTSMIGLMMPVIFTVMFVVIRQEARIFALTTVKTQGDFILNAMKLNIRNQAISVHNAYPGTSLNEICTTVSATPVVQNPLILRDRAGNSFYFSETAGAVASNSSVLAVPLTLTNNKVQITGLSFSCNRPSLYSSPIITVSYTVNYITQTAESPASLPYRTRIKLRNE